MRKFLLLIALIISGVRIVSAQNEITIGNGTSSDYNAPFNNYYKHSWNETIYQKADIGGACTINSISYHRASASSYQTSTIKIYMGETTRSSMSSTTDWTPSSSLTLVYSGTNITIGDSEWETFTLNTPFEYSGEKNLVVVVAKTANSYTSSLKWYYTNSSNGNKVSMYRQNDSSTSFASHPGTNSGDQLLAYAANIKLGVAFTTGDDNNNDPNDYEYVDLNLPSGLKWATCNIGAKTPEEYGNTYAWGETQPKNEYTEANSLTFYKQLNDISGNAQYDAATANWGGNWRMPRKDEMEELMNQCTWTWTTQNGVVGYKVISKTNGKYIFLPAAGYVYGTQLSGEGNVGNYWTSTPYSYGDNSNGGAYGLDYYHSSSTDEIKFYTFSRPGGLKIRPVRGGNFDVPIAQYASVTTNEVSSFSQTTAVCGGNVTSDNGFTVTAKGVCWSTSTYPTIENNKTTDGSGVGTFTSNLSNLSPMTTYYVRAYATNAAGTTYGAQKSFTTAGSIEIGDNTTIRYNNSYSLKYIVTSAYPAECEVICPSIPSSGTSITIPSSVKIKNVECSVTSIGENAFENCYSYVTSIQIPNSVTTIGNRAFYGCSGLINIVIPNNVTSIGSYAFYGCSGLTNIVIPNNVTSIGSYAFYRCSSLTSIEIPYGITSIKDNTFQNCSKLTNIEIPYSVTSIGNNAFQDCSKLTSIEIPSSVTTIGNGAFKFCSALKNVNISNGVTTIGNSAFYNSGLTSIEIPNSVITIGNEVFKYCHGLTSVKIPNSVTSIGSSTFYNCDKLTSIEMPNSITSIGESAFYGCSVLTGLEIPNSVTSIGNSAFYGCSAFTSLEIPNGVTSIGNMAFSSCSSLKIIKCYAENVPTAGSGVFKSCHSNMVIYVPSASFDAYKATESWGSYNVQPFGSVGDYIEIDYDTYILKYTVTNVEPKECEVICKTKPESETAITIPSSVSIDGKEYSVTRIGNSAFNGCSLLKGIVIPNGVTSIGSSTFYNCSSLTNIEIPNGVTYIGGSAFYNCSSLTGGIVIPNGVTSIGSSTFYNCSSLTSVVIPSSVTSIGNYAFEKCSSLNNIYSYNTIPATLGGTYAFYNISSSAKIYVPSVSLDEYKSKWGWQYSGLMTGMPTYTSDGWIDSNGNTVDTPAETDYVAINAPMVLSGNTRANDVLTVNTLGMTENGSLTIEDGAQLIANKVIGEVTIEKDILGYDGQQSTDNGQQTYWYTISSPLQDAVEIANSSLIDGTYDLYRYDEPSYTWQNYKNSANNGFTTLEAGRGYLYANAKNTTLELTGAVNTDDVTYTLTTDGSDLTGFHLIGNPFTHDIYMNQHIPTSVNEKQILVNGYYALTGDGAWAATASTTEAIKPMQGILVKALQEGDLVISRQPSAKRSQQTTDNRQQSLFTLFVTNGKYSDKAFVVFDKGVGLDKINHENENIPMLYVPVDNVNYAIAMLDENVNEIPVNFETKVMGQYTISLQQENCEFDELYLLDKETGDKVNILEQDYTFMAMSNDNPERFVLMTENGQQTTDNGHFAYINNGLIIIDGINGSATVNVFDMMGRCVYSVNSADESCRIDLTNVFAKGAYIIQKIDDNGFNTQKIIID